ncbi:hypothetical protein B0F90DRAFT_1621119 [Multifurca ochricompacta]|uniref:N-acetyltransferase domain-containing protein n=1 Tax=Multifurca ochricompacta TaxID=376703 RepID=A0AAD4MFF5_9AGAM|nr:hypothetical protein B0F90DRAFT_1621119 [Multifurca ochricompacta]
MPESTRARIRAYSAQDEKQVRFMVGQAQMESLAYANNRAYFHPLTLAVWIGISSMFAHYMDWWPNSSYGIWSWLQVLPAFFAPAVPVMFYIDWKNRPFIENSVENVLRRIDLLDIQAYYALSPASGFWLLEYGDKIIGLIAIDASMDATNDEPVAKPTSEGRLRTEFKQKGTSSVATIRHFFGEEAYRRVNIEDDLLQVAVNSTFTADKSVNSIRILASPLRPAILESIRRNKFCKGDRVETVGILGWEVCWYKLKREQWVAEKEKERS